MSHFKDYLIEALNEQMADLAGPAPFERPQRNTPDEPEWTIPKDPGGGFGGFTNSQICAELERALEAARLRLYASPEWKALINSPAYQAVQDYLTLLQMHCSGSDDGSDTGSDTGSDQGSDPGSDPFEHGEHGDVAGDGYE